MLPGKDICLTSSPVCILNVLLQDQSVGELLVADRTLVHHPDGGLGSVNPHVGFQVSLGRECPSTDLASERVFHLCVCGSASGGRSCNLVFDNRWRTGWDRRASCSCFGPGGPSSFQFQTFELP